MAKNRKRLVGICFGLMMELIWFCRSKVDPSGFPPGLVDPSNPGGVWQGPPPGSQPPSQLQPGPSHLIHPPPPPHHHPGFNAGRMPMMPPRDPHFQ